LVDGVLGVLLRIKELGLVLLLYGRDDLIVLLDLLEEIPDVHDLELGRTLSIGIIIGDVVIVLLLSHEGWTVLICLTM
jgi:hypothetical protein